MWGVWSPFELTRAARAAAASRSTPGFAAPTIEDCCRPSSRGEAGEKTGPSRKVRTPQGGVVGGTDPGKPAGKCHRNTPPKRRASREPGAGKGEMVR